MVSARPGARASAGTGMRVEGTGQVGHGPGDGDRRAVLVGDRLRPPDACADEASVREDLGAAGRGSLEPSAAPGSSAHGAAGAAAPTPTPKNPLRRFSPRPSTARPER